VRGGVAGRAAGSGIGRVLAVGAEVLGRHELGQRRARFSINFSALILILRYVRSRWSASTGDAASWTGKACIAAAGAIADGPVSVQGNMLDNDTVLAEMLAA
ncbi:DUF1028 domain-containing protein, partial [Mycolicibacterium farcinogenes]|nr:DUF1028 domain-containing protein [Mycolicibacterium farcinogenes]